MDAHPQLVKSQVQKQLLGLVHHAQLLRGDLLAVHKAGGQAGEGLLVPGGQPQLVGVVADLLLGQSHVAQRAFDLQLGHGLQAGAVVAVVVHVGAFGYILQIVFFRNCDNFLEQFMLAQVAAVLGVMGEALDVQLLGLNDDLPDALGLAEGSGLLQFPLGE